MIWASEFVCLSSDCRHLPEGRDNSLAGLEHWEIVPPPP